MNFCSLDMIYEESQKFVSFALLLSRLLWMLHIAFIQHSLFAEPAPQYNCLSLSTTVMI